AVTTCSKLLSVDQDVIGNYKRGRFVRARAPHMTVRHDRNAIRSLVLIIKGSFPLGIGRPSCRWVAPDLSTFYTRTTVSDRHIGDSDSLHHTRHLTRARRDNLRERRTGAAQNKQHDEQGNRTTLQGTHDLSPGDWIRGLHDTPNRQIQYNTRAFQPAF